MNFSRDFTDYKYQAEQDAIAIASSHQDEIATALVKWRKGDTVESFDVANNVHGADAWVDDKHSLAGCSIDMWNAVAILTQIPDRFHESDKGQWVDDTCVKTVESCGIYSYSAYVEHQFSTFLEAISTEALRFPKLTKRQALKIIEEALAE